MSNVNNKNISLEILISTKNRDNLDFLNNIFIKNNTHSNSILIINQTHKTDFSCPKIDNINLININEIGLSKSRNLAINNAKSDICLLADDDILYEENFDSIIISAFNLNPSADIITFKMNDLNGNSLVLFNYVEKHGKPLFELINNKVDEKRKVFFVSGEVATSDREAIRKIVEKQKNAIIVASLGTFSTGINIRNLHNIIFASPSKSQIRVLQSIGRGLRKSDNNEPTMLYDIIDNLYINKRKNFALIHSEERLKIYEKEQFTNESHRIKI